MGHHHKAASCSALPSFQSFTSISTSSTKASSLFDQEYNPHQQPTSSNTTANLKRSISPLPSNTISKSQTLKEKQQLFPLPSFCLYSKRALANEYAPESDIIQFLSPVSSVLEERLPMFVGVLQSLFTVVNDMPFINEETDDEDDNDMCGSDTDVDEDDDDGEEDLEEEEDQEEAEDRKAIDLPFTVIGLNSMKFVVWNNMYDNKIDLDNLYEKDLCLVVIVSAQLSDKTILESMNLLRRYILSSFPTSSTAVTANDLGEQLIPLIECWFDIQ